MKSLFAGLVLLQYLSAQSQIRWDGEGNDGKWNTNSNWVGNTMPTAIDQVVLDNSILPGNFTVTLPDTSVILVSLTISPLPGNTIKVILPSSNTLSANAFVVTGSVYGLVINNGGIFQNSSGSLSGTVLSISDSLRINNGGLYKHNTRSAHAGYVSILSRDAGTDNGIFEFDVPSPNSYAVSISNRVYGSLVLSATAAGGLKSYFSSGSNPITIRGDWHINPGVTYGLDLNDTVFVNGNFIQHPSSKFNIANSTNSAVLYLTENLVLDTLIKTGTGLPQIHLAGNTNQLITSTAPSANPATWFINNAAGVTLTTNLFLSSVLILNAGKILIGANTLTAAEIRNASADRYIVTNGNGFLKMSVGNIPVVFPIGPDSNSYNPVSITNGGGINYSIRVDTGINPVIAFPTYGINRTWNIFSSSTPAGPATVRFQYNASGANPGCDPAGIMEVLRYIQPAWNIISSDLIPSGNDPYIISTTINSFNTPFAIGRNGGWALPLRLVHFDAVRSGMSIIFKWRLSGESSPGAKLDIEYSINGLNFSKLTTMQVRENTGTYNHLGSLTPGIKYARLRLIDAIGNSSISTIVRITNDEKNMYITAIKPMPVHDLITAMIISPRKQKAMILITDILGRIIVNNEQELNPGSNSISLHCGRLARGTYTIFCVTGTERTNIFRFIK